MNNTDKNADEKHQNINNLKNENNQNEPSILTNAEESEKIKNKNQQKIKEELTEEEIKYENVKDSRFKQQRLPAWRPVPSIISIIIIFSFFGLAFIALGIILLIYSRKIKTEEVDYTDCEDNKYCIKNITIKEDIPQPIFVYYQLDGFFQNSRRYVKSKQVDQLTGDNIESTKNCDDFETNEEMGFNKETKNFKNTNYLIPGNIAVPCGLLAKTFFNDSYNFTINGVYLKVHDDDIAFERDKELFKNSDTSKQWINIENERFLIWIRPAGLPNPRKLWGRIEQDLKKDDNISINITNNYDVSYYEGKKKIILNNTTIFGGKNIFLAICYLGVGGLSLLSVIFFLIGYKIQMKKEKDV